MSPPLSLVETCELSVASLAKSEPERACTANSSAFCCTAAAPALSVGLTRMISRRWARSGRRYLSFSRSYFSRSSRSVSSSRGLSSREKTLLVRMVSRKRASISGRVIPELCSDSANWASVVMPYCSLRRLTASANSAGETLIPRRSARSLRSSSLRRSFISVLRNSSLRVATCSGGEVFSISVSPSRSRRAY